MVADDAEVGNVKQVIYRDQMLRVNGISSTNLEKIAKDAQQPADFETAIAATGYGKFNFTLMLCSLPAFWSAVAVPSSVSYIFTRAKCDMSLSMLDMGALVAITYGGMISSAMIWGFLSDTLGRKKIMVWGFIGTGVFDIAGSMSQNFMMLLISRFMCGFLFNGPFAVLLSYIAELHRTELRAKVMLFSNLFYSVAHVTLPLLAWAFLIYDWTIPAWGDSVVIHSWNIFMMTSALVPLITGLGVTCLPESPKFYMSRGRNEEALEIFQKVYSMNTGRPKEDYPIKCLVEEKLEKSAQGIEALKGGFKQFAPLFQRPHGPWLLLMCAIQIGSMLGANTLRLWYPQLAAMLGSDDQGTLCSAIAPANTTNILPEELELCVPIETDMETYMQNCVVGAGSIFAFALGGFIVNKCGKKQVAGWSALVSAVLATSLPFLGTGPYSVVVIICTVLASTSLCGACLASIMVDLFPTSLRVMALAIFLMSGRLGTMAGAMTFPALMEFGCLPPFLGIAAVLTAIGLACFVLPNTTLKKLE